MPDDPNARRVLVVDDEKNIRLTLRQVLEEEGLHVETAPDGEAALEQLRQAPGFALVLLDLRMPGVGGMEALPQIRDLDADVPVVVFTAHGNAENATEAMKRGATDFAEKPFSPTQIRDLVRSLDGAAPAEPSGPAPDDPMYGSMYGSVDEDTDERDETEAPRHAHRTLVVLEEAVSAEALLSLATASAHSYERGEVVAVRLGGGPEDDGNAPGAPASDMDQLGAAVRTRVAEDGDLQGALPALLEEETPDHVLLAWSGPPAAARRRDAWAQDLAGAFDCEVTLARAGHAPPEQPSSRGAGHMVRATRSAHHRVAALVSRAPHALVAVRRALEYARSAGVASLTLLSAQQVPAEGDEDRLQRDGRALIRQVARQAGLSEGQYRAQVTVATDRRALARAAEDFDTLCVSAAHADELVPALFGDDEGSGRIVGTVALVRGPEHEEPTILESLVSRLSGA